MQLYNKTRELVISTTVQTYNIISDHNHTFRLQPLEIHNQRATQEDCTLLVVTASFPALTTSMRKV